MLRLQHKPGLQIVRHDQASSDLHIHAAIAIKRLAHALVSVGPPKRKAMGDDFARLQQTAGARLSPCAARLELRAGLGVDEHGEPILAGRRNPSLPK